MDNVGSIELSCTPRLVGGVHCTPTLLWWCRPELQLSISQTDIDLRQRTSPLHAAKRYSVEDAATWSNDMYHRHVPGNIRSPARRTLTLSRYRERLQTDRQCQCQTPSFHRLPAQQIIRARSSSYWQRYFCSSDTSANERAQLACVPQSTHDISLASINGYSKSTSTSDP